MFERFTADARRTVELAVEVAEEIGHGYLGAEHLLIALAGTGPSIATEALIACGFDPRRARRDLERIEPSGGSGLSEADAAALRGRVCGLPVMPKAKQALVLALREAIRLGHRRIGPEHVLLGLLRLNAISTQLLMAQGIDAGRLREEVLRGSEELGQRGA